MHRVPGKRWWSTLAGIAVDLTVVVVSGLSWSSFSGEPSTTVRLGRAAGVGRSPMSGQRLPCAIQRAPSWGATVRRVLTHGGLAVMEHPVAAGIANGQSYNSDHLARNRIAVSHPVRGTKSRRITKAAIPRGAAMVEAQGRAADRLAANGLFRGTSAGVGIPAVQSTAARREQCGLMEYMPNGYGIWQR